jgi:hypothetical protein
MHERQVPLGHERREMLSIYLDREARVVLKGKKEMEGGKKRMKAKSKTKRERERERGGERRKRKQLRLRINGRNTFSRSLGKDRACHQTDVLGNFASIFYRRRCWVRCGDRLDVSGCAAFGKRKRLTFSSGASRLALCEVRGRGYKDPEGSSCLCQVSAKPLPARVEHLLFDPLREPPRIQLSARISKDHPGSVDAVEFCPARTLASVSFARLALGACQERRIISAPANSTALLPCNPYAPSDSRVRTSLRYS